MAVKKGTELDLRCRLFNPRSPLTTLVVDLEKIEKKREKDKVWIERERETAQAICDVFGASMPPDEFFEGR